MLPETHVNIYICHYCVLLCMILSAQVHTQCVCVCVWAFGSQYPWLKICPCEKGQKTDREGVESARLRHQESGNPISWLLPLPLMHTFTMKRLVWVCSSMFAASEVCRQMRRWIFQMSAWCGWGHHLCILMSGVKSNIYKATNYSCQQKPERI